MPSQMARCTFASRFDEVQSLRPFFVIALASFAMRRFAMPQAVIEPVATPSLPSGLPLMYMKPRALSVGTA